jgi:hypothetical protein
MPSGEVEKASLCRPKDAAKILDRHGQLRGDFSRRVVATQKQDASMKRIKLVQDGTNGRLIGCLTGCFKKGSVFRRLWIYQSFD